MMCEANKASAGSASGLKREVVAWALFDFAQLGSYTVVLTTIFNCYFINVVAGGEGHYSSRDATLIWTLMMAASSLLVVVTAPVLGVLADSSGMKKQLLAAVSLLFAASIVLLGFIGPGDLQLAVPLVMICNLMSWSGLTLAAAFLPEISSRQTIGKISGFGGALGYAGILVMLSGCMSYVAAAEHCGQTVRQFVPVALDITALLFIVSSLPSFFFLKDQDGKNQLKPGFNYISIAFARLRHSMAEAEQFTDLKRFLLAVATYSCGASTVSLLAAVYAQNIMGFSQSQVIGAVLITSLAAGVGAMAFGRMQDKLGSVATLKVVLYFWIAATLLASIIPAGPLFWLVAILIGIAAGGLKGVSRALVGQFSPRGRSGEFFGLWGLAINLSYAIGPLVYGLTAYLSDGNQRLAVLSTTCFFLVGLAFLSSVQEQRGIAAAQFVENNDSQMIK